jgi:phosphoribosylformylglycinamidine cyclo-ligase
MYAEGEYDLAGFTVGVVARAKIIDGKRVAEGDKVIGLASSGLHSNGFSLARKALLETHPLDWRPPELAGRTVGDALLEPTRIYAKDVLALLDAVPVKALGHITGGGLPGNVPRNLPEGTKAVLDARRWPRPAIFDLVQREGEVPWAEMFLTFNMGLGLVAVVAPSDVAAAQAALSARGLASFVVGGVEKGAGEATCEVVR